MIGLFTFKNSNKFNYLIIYLFILSIIMEITHMFIPERSFEFPDLFGNLLGVLIVLTVYFFYKKYENYKN
jgi:glycopeptide antibiotics resistance protein